MFQGSLDVRVKDPRIFVPFVVCFLVYIPQVCTVSRLAVGRTLDDISQLPGVRKVVIDVDVGEEVGSLE